MPFTDRTDAGRQLADRLAHLRGSDPVVLAVPPGGVPVAVEVAHHLGAPLDVLAIQRLPRPFQPSVAMAAVAEDRITVVDDAVVGGLHIGLDRLAAMEVSARQALATRASGSQATIDIDGRTAVLVLDGIVTGLSARAAARVARHRGAARIVVAAPVCAAPALARCRREVDGVVCLVCPPGVPALRDHYREFPDVSDADAAALRNAFANRCPTGAAST